MSHFHTKYNQSQARLTLNPGPELKVQFDKRLVISLSVNRS